MNVGIKRIFGAVSDWACSSSKAEIEKDVKLGYRDATITEFVDWVVGYLRKGGEIRSNDLLKDDLVNAMVIAETDDLSIFAETPDIRCILPLGNTVVCDNLSDNTFYHMGSFAIQSSNPCVPISSDVISQMKGSISEKEHKLLISATSKVAISILVGEDTEEGLEAKFGVRKDLQQFHVSIMDELGGHKDLNEQHKILTQEKEVFRDFFVEEIKQYNGNTENLSARWQLRNAGLNSQLDDVKDKLEALSECNKPQGELASQQKTTVLWKNKMQ